MAHHGVDQRLVRPRRPEQFRRLLTVLVRPLFKVDVVEEARQGPEAGLLPIAQLLGVPAHHALHGQGMENVKGLLVVLAQQLQRLFSGLQHVVISFV